MNDQKHCSSCGEANPSEARFCLKCGELLRAAPVTGTSLAPPSRAHLKSHYQKSPERKLKRWHIVAISCLAVILVILAGFSFMLTTKAASEFQTGIPLQSAVSTMTKNGPAVLLINQNGCPPCDTIKPRLADLEGQYKGRGVTFATLTIDDNKTSYNVARTYGVSITPTVLVVLPDGAFASFIPPQNSCAGNSDPKCGEVDLNQVRGALDNVLQGNVREVKAASSLVDQASNTQTQAQNSDLSSYFSQTYFGAGGTTIVEKNFTKSVNYRGNDVYTGVVRRTDRSVGAGFTAVVELAKSQTDAKKLLSSTVAKAQKDGYTYRSDWVAELQSEQSQEHLEPMNELWCGSLPYYGQTTIYYQNDFGANSWLVVTETS